MDDKSLVPITEPSITAKPNLSRIGKAARQLAPQHALRMYHKTLADNTIKRHQSDLEVFARYLKDAGEPIGADRLMFDLEAWAGATEWLLEGFKEWMLKEGFSIGSVNVRLSTVKKYYEIASRAGFLDESDLGLIKSVYGYRGKEGRNVDQKRPVTSHDDKIQLDVAGQLAQEKSICGRGDQSGDCSSFL